MGKCGLCDREAFLVADREAFLIACVRCISRKKKKSKPTTDELREILKLALPVVLGECTGSLEYERAYPDEHEMFMHSDDGPRRVMVEASRKHRQPNQSCT